MNFKVNSTMITSGPSNFDVWHANYKPYAKAVDMIWTIGNPTVLLFGIFGNFMIILIMFRLPASTSGVFFQVLAWSDQVLLIVGPLNVLLHREFGVPYFHELNSWLCKISVMMFYMTTALSPWMLVALTMLRAASVLWPHRVNAVWTKKMSRVTAGVMVFIIALINCHCLYGYDINTSLSFNGCWVYAASEMYQWFTATFWPWIVMTERCFVPFTVLVVSNSALLWSLVRSVRMSKQLTMQQTSQESGQRKVSSLTVTLIATCTAFFVLTAPLQVHDLTYHYVDSDDPIEYGQNRVFLAVSNVLAYSNSAINFYLYCLTGSKFRAEFGSLIFGVFSLFQKSKKVREGHSYHR